MCNTHNFADAFSLIERHGHVVRWILTHPKWLPYLNAHPQIENRDNTLGVLWDAEFTALYGVPKDRMYLFTDWFHQGKSQDDMTQVICLDMGPHLRIKKGVHF